jgi:hypothetical protein
VSAGAGKEGMADENVGHGGGVAQRFVIPGEPLRVTGTFGREY